MKVGMEFGEGLSMISCASEELFVTRWLHIFLYLQVYIDRMKAA